MGVRPDNMIIISYHSVFIQIVNFFLKFSKSSSYVLEYLKFNLSLILNIISYGKQVIRIETGE